MIILVIYISVFNIEILGAAGIFCYLVSLVEPKLTDLMNYAKFQLTIEMPCVVFQLTPHIKTTTLAHT